MNNYNILVLGASGSGKTSFLASMYDKLSVQRPSIGFFVEFPENERKILVNKYREMENPTKEWPAGTKDVDEWKITCSVHAGDKNYPLLEFAYLDYAGGKLSEPESSNPSESFSIDKAAEDAEAILILLDGLKILHQLKGEQEKLSSPLHNDLRFILPIVQKYISKPLHFVITKWDLLEGTYNLKQVRESLLEDERLSAIVAQRRTHHNPTRLIPVSAVGKGFATLSQDNTMVKNPKGVARPFQVEIPVACVLIDGFEIAQRSLTDEQKKKAVERKGFWRRLLQRLTGAGEAVSTIPLPPQYSFPLLILRALFGFANKELTVSLEQLERERDTLLMSIRNYDGALQSLVISYQVLISRLEKEYPESNLHTA